MQKRRSKPFGRDAWVVVALDVVLFTASIVAALSGQPEVAVVAGGAGVGLAREIARHLLKR